MLNTSTLTVEFDKLVKVVVKGISYNMNWKNFLNKILKHLRFLTFYVSNYFDIISEVAVDMSKIHSIQLTVINLHPNKIWL